MRLEVGGEVLGSGGRHRHPCGVGTAHCVDGSLGTSTHEGRDGRVRRVGVEFVDGRGKVRESDKSIHDLVLLFSPNSSSFSAEAGSVASDEP